MYRNPFVVPTGVSSDGSKYYCDNDFTTGDASSDSCNASASLKLLTTGNIPLLLDPKYWYNRKQDIFQGQPVPIFCAKEVASGHLLYRHKHVIQEDKDTGKALIICSREWAQSRSFNIGSLQQHTRDVLWIKVGPPPLLINCQV